MLEILKQPKKVFKEVYHALVLIKLMAIMRSTFSVYLKLGRNIRVDDLWQ